MATDMGVDLQPRNTVIKASMKRKRLKEAGILSEVRIVFPDARESFHYIGSHPTLCRSPHTHEYIIHHPLREGAREA